MERLTKQSTVKGPAEMFTGDVWFDVIARGPRWIRAPAAVGGCGFGLDRGGGWAAWTGLVAIHRPARCFTSAALLRCRIASGRGGGFRGCVESRALRRTWRRGR
jgi:hypothetical protein